MNKSIWQPFIYAVLIVIGLLLGIWLKPSTGDGGFLSAGKSKITQLLSIIDQAYVDTVNTDSLEEIAINDLLNQLDPHSVYIAASDVQQANEGLEGNFEGVGIEFSILDDTIMVANPLKDGPAAKLGILAGDRIIKVDTVDVAGVGIKNEQVFKLLRGPAGTKVNVQIYRPDGHRKLAFTIPRGQIPIYSIDAALMINNQTGYIKIERFAASTHDEFLAALQKLQSQHMQHLILDLRNNPGGYLSAATALADEFLNDKKLVVYTEGRTQKRTEYKAEQPGNFETGKLIVLIDEGSASASEIVSGAIQDWDRGVILGRRSFGKGLVQEPFSLNDGSVVRLTISRYYTPAGRCIQKDYTEGYDAYEHEVINRYADGETSDISKHKQKDSTPYQTANKRIVYGGGGITPDVFVPVDTSYLTAFYATIFEQTLIQRYTYNYIDENRKKLLNTYGSAGLFNAGFAINDEFWNGFMKYVYQNSKDKIEPVEVKKSEQQVRLMLKAMIARQLWRDEGYFTVLNGQDKMIRKALETFGSNYNKLLKP